MEDLGRNKVCHIWDGAISVGEGGIKGSHHLRSSSKSSLCQPQAVRKQKGGPVPAVRCWGARRRDGVVMKFHVDVAELRLNFSGSLCTHVSSVGPVGKRRAQDCPGTAKIPSPLCFSCIRALKSFHTYFFNTHNSVVWCLVNSCLTAEHTAVSFTHPLEMLKLEEKNYKAEKRKGLKKR